jgi:hypothetical protein
MAVLRSHLDHFVWEFLQRVPRRGYQLVSDAEGRRFLAPRVGRRIERRRTVAVFQAPTLLHDLPRPDDHDAKLLAFASRYGLLGTRPFTMGADEGESIKDWRKELKALHDARAGLNKVRDGDKEFRKRVAAAEAAHVNESWIGRALLAFEGDQGDQQLPVLSATLTRRLADVSVRIEWSSKAQAFTWKLAVPNLLTALWLRVLWEEGVIKKRLCQCGCGTPIDSNPNGTKRYFNPHHKSKVQARKRKAARAAQRVAMTRAVRSRTSAQRSRRRPKR